MTKLREVFEAMASATRVVAVVTVAGITCLMLIVVSPAGAQTTTPPWYSYNQPTLTSTWPSTAPSETHTANAIVVEGLYPCEGSSYSISSVETWTAYWVNQGLQTITEITPYASCTGYTTISAYETELNDIEKYVEANTTNPGRYWGGLMLDEEPGWGFSASQLETLNTYVQNVMAGSSGMSWYFTENQPNGWVQATYNAILEGSWPAPQAYTVGANSMIAAINAECAANSAECTNMLTIDAAGSYSAGNNHVTISGEVNGAAWSSSYWGSSTWVNYWQS